MRMRGRDRHETEHPVDERHDGAHADEGHPTRTERYDEGAGHPGVAADRHTVVAREREEHGGIKWGSAFFGWLTATGTAVLLTALLSAVGAAVGLATLADADGSEISAEDAGTVGVVGGIALLVILFVAYWCGGYVAGRMARFDGARQGLAVWLWALVVALVVALLALAAGDQYNVLFRLDSLPRVPVGEGELATGGIVTAVLAALTSLLGAVLGGVSGMRFHRRVDRTGLGH